MGSSTDALDSLLNLQPAFRSWYIPEPMLIFGNNGLCEDPKSGLQMYGPAALTRGPRTTLRLGIVGTGELIEEMRRWLIRARSPIMAVPDRADASYDPILAPAFPGFSADSPFKCEVELDTRLQERIPEDQIAAICRITDARERVGSASRLIMNLVAALAERDPCPDAIILVLPETLDQVCGPRSRVKSSKIVLSEAEKKLRKLSREKTKTGQENLFGLLGDDDESDFSKDDEEEDSQGIDLHDMIKARAMSLQMPTQFVWESTLRRTRSTQDPATVAWNFFAALCYKCGNTPWELHLPEKDTCYVGVSFFLDRNGDDETMQTSLAQVFSQNGDGYILRGQPANVDRSRDRKAHLTKQSAYQLLSNALQMYQKQEHSIPKRVVLHKTSRFWPDELEGFRDAVKHLHTYDFLALDYRGIRFVRLGQEPPLRGSVVELARRNYLIFTHGYVPFIRCYPGMRIPNPVEIVEHHGDSDASRICSEILALTKLNWNNCGYANSEPITLAFARRVGRILKEMPTGAIPQSRYKYYM